MFMASVPVNDVEAAVPVFIAIRCGDMSCCSSFKASPFMESVPCEELQYSNRWCNMKRTQHTENRNKKRWSERRWIDGKILKRE